MEVLKILTSGDTLPVLEFISQKDFRSFTDIKKKFNLVNGEVSDYLSKLQSLKYIERYENRHTKQFEGWQATKRAKDKLKLIFATIENAREDLII